MTGRLMWVRGWKFCVTYEDRGVYVIWQPGLTTNALKPASWIDEAYPMQRQVPENMLRDLIASRAHFFDRESGTERKVEIKGLLEDGGEILIGYVKGIPPEVMTDRERAEATETLREWTNSYLRADI